MKVFQIFSHPFPPCAPYQGFMEAIRDVAESYTLIAPRNFMGPKAEFYPIAQAWADLPEYLRRANGARLAFDALRVRYLSHHFDHVYLDVDVELLAPIALGKAPQAAGPGVLVGNGSAADGLSAWATYLRLAPHFPRPASLMFAGMHPQEVPAHAFRHLYARGKYY